MPNSAPGLTLNQLVALQPRLAAVASSLQLLSPPAQLSAALALPSYPCTHDCHDFNGSHTISSSVALGCTLCQRWHFQHLMVQQLFVALASALSKLVQPSAALAIPGCASVDHRNEADQIPTLCPLISWALWFSAIQIVLLCTLSRMRWSPRL